MYHFQIGLAGSCSNFVRPASVPFLFHDTPNSPNAISNALFQRATVEVLPIPHFRTSASEIGNFTFRDTKKSTTWFATWFNVAQWRHLASNFGPGLGPAGFRAVLGLVPLEATW
jgi:hypothetical protein